MATLSSSIADSALEAAADSVAYLRAKQREEMSKQTYFECSFHTNLDDYQREAWPPASQAILQEGDRVRAKSGKELVVVGRTLLHDGTFYYELHQRFWKTSDI